MGRLLCLTHGIRWTTCFELMLTPEQTREDNKEEFVLRLIEAGWTRKEAEAEYDRATEDESE